MRTTMCVEVKTKSGKTYGFTFRGDPKYLDEWRSEGIEVYEVLNSTPLWAQQLGLTHVWFFVQDVWRFLRIW